MWHQSDHLETVTFACDALYSLVDASTATIVDVFIDLQVVERLREKLHQLTTAKVPKVAVMDAIISSLDAIAGCATDEQLLELTCITPYLADIIITALAKSEREVNYDPAHKKRNKLLITTLTCMVSICEGNGRILEKTLGYRKEELFPTMFTTVQRSTLIIQSNRIDMVHYNCYLAIAFAVSAADAEQIDFFVTLRTGVYGFLFATLISLPVVGSKDHTKQIVKIILCTFNAFCNLIRLKSVNHEIRDIQRVAESHGLLPAQGWAKVHYLAHDYPTEVSAIPEDAKKLFGMAIVQGLTVPWNARRRTDGGDGVDEAKDTAATQEQDEA